MQMEFAIAARSKEFAHVVVAVMLRNAKSAVWCFLFVFYASDKRRTNFVGNS